MDRKNVIVSRMRELEKELSELARFGEDVYKDGDVLIFVVNFGGATEYTFAALKMNNMWFLTGRRNEVYMTWDTLVSFWRDKGVVSLRKVTRTKNVLEVQS